MVPLTRYRKQWHSLSTRHLGQSTIDHRPSAGIRPRPAARVLALVSGASMLRPLYLPYDIWL